MCTRKVIWTHIGGGECLDIVKQSMVGLDNNVEIIANDQGYRTTPSYVAFTDTERLIGDSAKNQASMNPENTVYG